MAKGHRLTRPVAADSLTADSLTRPCVPPMVPDSVHSFISSHQHNSAPQAGGAPKRQVRGAGNAQL